jgi:uncharacterized coiled-coil protein SlyX
MASDSFATLPEPPVEAGQRLGEQLHALSRVAETLTYRLLDLEERLAAQEQMLGSLIGPANRSDPGQVERIDQRLAETEARLAHMEELLAGAEPLSSSRHLQALPSTLPSADRRGDGPGISDHLLSEEAFNADPFPEEGEQLFMDERIA